MSTTTTDPFTVTMRAGEADVVIYDAIGKSSFLEDGFTSKRLAEQLKSLGRVSAINVRINSPGGSLPEAIGIFNALRNSGSRIVAHVDGFALSSASLIAMAGDEIRMAEGTWLMIHNPTLPVHGDYTELRSMADLMERFTSSAADIYAKRTGKTREQITAMMAEETWLDASEALAQGFADKITPELKVAAHFDLADFQNVPAMLQKDIAMPTVKEIKDACPGCDDSFVIRQLEAGATVQVAMTAWMAEQQQQIATMKRAAPAAAPGVSPLGTGRSSAPAAFIGDAIAMFDEEVQAVMERHKIPRYLASTRVCRKNPDLRAAYVQAWNETRRK